MKSYLPIHRSLALSRETLRRLSERELQTIAGGDTQDGFCTDVFGCDTRTLPIPIPGPSEAC